MLVCIGWITFGPTTKCQISIIYFSSQENVIRDRMSLKYCLEQENLDSWTWYRLCFRAIKDSAFRSIRNLCKGRRNIFHAMSQILEVFIWLTGGGWELNPQKPLASDLSFKIEAMIITKFNRSISYQIIFNFSQKGRTVGWFFTSKNFIYALVFSV